MLSRLNAEPDGIRLRAVVVHPDPAARRALRAYIDRFGAFDVVEEREDPPPVDRLGQYDVVVDGRGPGPGAAPSVRGALTVHRGRRLLRLPFERIEYLEADGDYVVVHAGGAIARLHMTLCDLLQQLPGDRFFRVHRSLVLNFDRVVEVRPEGRGRFVARLDTGQTLRVSRAQVKTLRARLLSLAAHAASLGGSGIIAI